MAVPFTRQSSRHMSQTQNAIESAMASCPVTRPPTRPSCKVCGLASSGMPISLPLLAQGESRRHKEAASTRQLTLESLRALDSFVDIYLYHADSETVATTYPGISNARGSIGIRPDDEWWPEDQTTWTEGQNQTWPYYFIIVDANTTLTGGESRQAIFSAIRESPSGLGWLCASELR